MFELFCICTQQNERNEEIHIDRPLFTDGLTVEFHTWADFSHSVISTQLRVGSREAAIWLCQSEHLTLSITIHDASKMCLQMMEELPPIDSPISW